MFRKSYQRGFLSILYSCGSAPLAIWDKQVKNGYIKRITDDEVKSLVLEIAGTNVATTFIYCPRDAKKVLGIRLPFLIMIIKNMKKYFTFEITILDDKDMHRRFRVSNFQSTTRVRPFCTTMPIGLSGGWNQIQFNLADFTRRAYGSNYVETTRMQIHANCRIRRIYYADRLYSEDEMPEEFKLFLPINRRKSSHETRQSKTIVSNDKNNSNNTDRGNEKLMQGEGDVIMSNEPPSFSINQEGAESETINDENNTQVLSAPKRISDTRSRSSAGNAVPRKSLSASNNNDMSQSKRKSVGVTIEEESTNDDDVRLEDTTVGTNKNDDNREDREEGGEEGEEKKGETVVDEEKGQQDVPESEAEVIQESEIQESME